MKTKSPLFVVQRHQARRLHYDFRLELDDVLKSWAVPKEPPTEIGVKRLAVQVEDHALDYAHFQGTIPEGEYGAGTVAMWDSGTFELVERDSAKIVFSLKGKKLKGVFCLIQLKNNPKNWLLFKK